MIIIKFGTPSLTTSNRLVVIGRVKIRTPHLPDAVNSNREMFLSPVRLLHRRPSYMTCIFIKGTTILVHTASDHYNIIYYTIGIFMFVWDTYNI